ncbi:MAG: methionine gamma-lyase family protein, partial [Lachnospiraceae bacterium]|nr:methionine gamma-lyase family protein [Lachnospiraceae bacterium]
MTEITTMYQALGISEPVLRFGREVEAKLKERFEEIDRITEYNQLKVIKGMQDCMVSAECFNYVSGYGYNDFGRDKLEEVYAKVFHTEDALVRPQITCGTHALALALSANLRPGDEMLSISGKPYDTLEEVIGIRPSRGSLAEYGVTYQQVDLLENGDFDFEGIRAAINERTKLIEIQRSKGYQTRPTLSVAKIGEAISFVKSINPHIICMVDNCYGELVETKEPGHVGADIVVGSLMKNLGGGIAPTGGYVAGNQNLVYMVAERLTAPGIGKDLGANFNLNNAFFKGIFMAPNAVKNALKTAIFTAYMLEKLEYSNVSPRYDEPRTDIIQTLELKSKENLVSFTQGIQQTSPIDSFVHVLPAPMPGYPFDEVMAAGSFTQGSTIELSADAPVIEPY